MPKRYLKIIERKAELFGETWKFFIKAEYSFYYGSKWIYDSMDFERVIHKSEINDNKLKEINNDFANSLRVLKHEGGYFSNDVTEDQANKIMNKWSSSNTGIALKVKSDKLPEFERFKL